MGFLFKLKKKLLTKAALNSEKKKLIKEAQARIESNELSQLQALRQRISKAKNINIPKNLEAEIRRRKVSKKMLLKQAGKAAQSVPGSLKTIGKSLSNLNKLTNRPIKKAVKKRVVKRKVKKAVKKRVKKAVKKRIRRKR